MTAAKVFCKLPEEWRPVVGYEGVYSVSSFGNVRRDGIAAGAKVGKILKPWLGGLNHTYFYVRLSKLNKTTFPRLHGLVAAAFIGPRSEGMQINHIDGNRHNNAAANLEYLTRRQNEDHAVALGLHVWGVNHPAAKLTEAQVREIRDTREAVATIAKRFGVSVSCVRAVVTRQTWKHLLDVAA